MDIVGTPSKTNKFTSWPFGAEVSPVFNNFLKIGYLVFLMLQFILALGNRPKGYVERPDCLSYNTKLFELTHLSKGP